MRWPWREPRVRKVTSMAWRVLRVRKVTAVVTALALAVALGVVEIGRAHV